MAYHKVQISEDPTAIGGKRIFYSGPSAHVVDYLAKGLNFTYVKLAFLYY